MTTPRNCAVAPTPTLDALHDARSYEHISRACTMAYNARECLKSEGVAVIYAEHRLALEEACAVYLMACVASAPVAAASPHTPVAEKWAIFCNGAKDFSEKGYRDNWKLYATEQRAQDLCDDANDSYRYNVDANTTGAVYVPRQVFIYDEMPCVAAMSVPKETL